MKVALLVDYINFSLPFYQGYINNPEATAACLDAEGYYHTGDVTVQDENGHFFIVDRIKELIKYKGFQVQSNHCHFSSGLN